MKVLNSFILLILFIMVLFSCKNTKNAEDKNSPNISTDANKYKEDYLEAIKLFTNKYIYLERKLDISRNLFLRNKTKYAESINWNGGKEQFISEIIKLTASMNDYHVSWSLDESLYLNERNKFLGFVMTLSKDEKVIVGDVYSQFINNINIGDRILSINGLPAIIAIEEFSKKLSNSSQFAGLEKATRLFTLELRDRPNRLKLEPVEFVIKDSAGNSRTVTANWKDCGLGSELETQNDDSLFVFMTRNKKPSLEEIPSDAEFIHQSLIYYFRDIHSKKYAILHPRDFYYWSASDLDKTFKNILSQNPDTLIIDLKDTAGGAFDPVIYLSTQIGIDRDYSFFSDTIGNDDKRITGIDNFNRFKEDVLTSHIWTGETILRINPICASGSDFFPKFYQLSNRGLIVGLPTSGAGGGTSSFKLKNTGTEIYIPMRERIFYGDNDSVEGNPIVPTEGYYTDSLLIDIIEQL